MTPRSERLGAPVTDLDDYVTTRSLPTCRPPTEPDRDVAREPGPGPIPRSWWLAPVLATLVVGAWMLGRSGSAPFPAPPATVAATPAGLMGFAETYVAAYLTGAGESTLRSFSAVAVAAPVNPYDRYVRRASAISLETIGADYWTVTVAADVLPRVDGGYGPGTIEYFDVAVATVDSGYLATGTPLPVSAPVATVPSGVYGELRAEGDDTLVVFLQEFLDAYLAGSGRIPRLVTFESGIVAVTPAPATTTDVTSVRIGDVDGSAWATAAAVMTDAAGTTLPVMITVRLVTTASGVRVAELLAGPPPLPTSTG